MPTYTTGVHLNEFLLPQLIKEFLNDKDDFIGMLNAAPKDAIDTDGIKMNKLISNVQVQINGDQSAVFTPTKMPTKKGLVPWDNLDTLPTEVAESEMRALPFDKRGQVRVKHMAALKRAVRDYVLHKYAPSDDSVPALPVIRTTGEIVDGRRRLTLKDLVVYRTLLKNLNLLVDGSDLISVLCPNHVEDLSLDRINLSDFGDKVVNVKNGQLKEFFGYTLFDNNACPFYAGDNTKKAIGASNVATDQQASVIIYRPTTIFHKEKVKIFYTEETKDTRNADPKSEFRLKGYLLADSTEDLGHGAVVSANG